MKLEIIGFNIESCAAAQKAGANRIELCANPAEGGTTPSYGFIKAARAKLSIELFVMIRPRGGDFVYSDEEFEIMKTDVAICRQSGCDGIVIGILNKDGTIDKKRVSQLVDYAYPLGATFHRAFDRTKDAIQSLEDVVETGCEKILTSGQQTKAVDGLQLIKELTQGADERIIIMPGSGVNAENILHIAEITGTVEFHSSAGMRKVSDMEFTNAGMNEEMSHIIVNKEEIEKMAAHLRNFEKLTADK